MDCPDSTIHQDPTGTSTTQPVVSTRKWLSFALITTIFWGVWGAFMEIPAKNGFPGTLGYGVWALTMVPCALVALVIARWRVEFSGVNVFLGLTIGILGSGGQLILFEALRLGPAYLVFPIIALFPVLTIALSVWTLKERASRRAWTGIIFALVAMVLLSYQPPNYTATRGYMWLFLTMVIFVAWAIQAWVLKFSNNRMSAETIFFYMAASSVLLIPIGLVMTDWNQPINWGFRGPWLTALIQVLNAIGALTLVYAVRYGKAIVVVPMTSLAPVLTIIISLCFWHVVPHPVIIVGMVLATVAILLMAE